MARVFTTTFQYDSRTYTALVTELENSLTITMVDGTLQLVVPLGNYPSLQRQSLKQMLRTGRRCRAW